MTRWVAILLAFAFVLATAGGVLAQTSDDRKHAIDEKLARLRNEIAAANQREGVLTSEISAVTAKIRSYEHNVDDASARLARLERELALFQARLTRVTELLRVQTEQLELLRRQNAIAQQQLNERLVAIYQSEPASTVEIVLAASSFGDLIDQLDFINEIGEQDRRIAEQVAGAKEKVRVARTRTQRARRAVAQATRAVADRTSSQRAERDRLLASQQALVRARGEKRETLASVRTTREEFVREVAGLERASAALAARLRAISSSGTVSSSLLSTTSSSGFVWPVAGPVTSGFGWRWGRMHEGIDIGAPTGAPIVAAASGTAIYVGWMDGFGNLVVLDHGGGLATAYAHQSSIGVGLGQSVSQGQVLGYVGCTGHCFGSHLHFEVRLGGAAVDPLGYL